jgi:hypothetical protein
MSEHPVPGREDAEEVEIEEEKKPDEPEEKPSPEDQKSLFTRIFSPRISAVPQSDVRTPGTR